MGRGTAGANFVNGLGPPPPIAVSDPTPEPLGGDWPYLLEPWIVGVALCTFDLDIGNKVEQLWPPDALCDQDQLNVAYHAFPDSMSARLGDTSFVFRIKLHRRPGESAPSSRRVSPSPESLPGRKASMPDALGGCLAPPDAHLRPASCDPGVGGGEGVGEGAARPRRSRTFADVLELRDLEGGSAPSSPKSPKSPSAARRAPRASPPVELPLPRDPGTPPRPPGPSPAPGSAPERTRSAAAGYSRGRRRRGRRCRSRRLRRRRGGAGRLRMPPSPIRTGSGDLLPAGGGSGSSGSLGTPASAGGGGGGAGEGNPLVSRSALSRNFLYGYALFRQEPDASIQRGFFQKSLVILSRQPLAAFFRRAAARLAPAYFARGAAAVEEFLGEVSAWPEPQEGETLELPVLGEPLQVRVPAELDLTKESWLAGPAPSPVDGCPAGPAHRQPPRSRRRAAGGREGGAGGARPALLGERPGLFQEVNLYETFGPLLPSLPLLWEIVLAAEPLLVFSRTPAQCGDAVLALASLIAPLPFAADFRPYFTLHDPDFAAFSRAGGPTRALLGVTNPFFLKALEDWPHVLAVGRPPEGPPAASSAPPPRPACPSRPPRRPAGAPRGGGRARGG
eukprot:tig00001472_g8887.t1